MSVYSKWHKHAKRNEIKASTGKTQVLVHGHAPEPTNRAERRAQAAAARSQRKLLRVKGLTK